MTKIICKVTTIPQTVKSLLYRVFAKQNRHKLGCRPKDYNCYFCIIKKKEQPHV